MNRVLLEIAAFVFVAALILTSAPMAVLKLGLHPELEGTATLRIRGIAGRSFALRHGLQADQWALMLSKHEDASRDSSFPKILLSTVKLQNYDH